MILVNAANGQQGKLLVPKLVGAGLKVRGCVQSERSAAELRAIGVADVIVGDSSEPDVIRRAMKGVEKVYHVSPGVHPRECEMGFAWIDAAAAEGVKHFVFSSVLHPILTDLVQHEIKRDIEEHLLSSKLEYTVLQPTIYMAPRRFLHAFKTGVLNTGWSLDRKQSLVDVGDIAEVAAKVLTDSAAHVGATYELVAPGRYNAREMGEIAARVLGKPIRVEQVDSETYFKGLFGDRDLSEMPHEASVARSLATRYSSDDFVGNPNVLAWLLGRTPKRFDEYVRTLSDQVHRSLSAGG